MTDTPQDLEDDSAVETLRYRAPAVVALSGERFAVLTPGWSSQWTTCETLEALHAALSGYIDWNVLEPRLATALKSPALGRLVALNPTDEEIERAWKLIGGRAP